MPPEPQDQHSGAGNIDLSNILLPKKEIHSVDSAQRVDAGTLLAQEQSATLVVPAAPVAIPPAPVPSVKKEGAEVRRLQTYQGDIEQVIQGQNVSVVSMAAAEAVRRGSGSIEADGELKAEKIKNAFRTTLFVVAGLVLVLGAGGLVGYAFLHNAALPAQTAGTAPFIAVDGINVVTLPQSTNANSVMDTLVAAKNSSSLSLGLVAQLYIQNTPTSSGALPTYVGAGELLHTLAPTMPETLLRNIQPIYLLGVHSFGANQPFLILKVDSYEQGYAGMLLWEATLKTDLAPLFTYIPPPHPAPAQVLDASSTPQTEFIQTGFVDVIVENHDARVLKNADGEIYFLWTFLDRQTIVITTNSGTLREVLSRLTQAPVVSLPRK